MRVLFLFLVWFSRRSSSLSVTVTVHEATSVVLGAEQAHAMSLAVLPLPIRVTRRQLAVVGRHRDPSRFVEERLRVVAADGSLNSRSASLSNSACATSFALSTALALFVAAFSAAADVAFAPSLLSQLPGVAAAVGVDGASGDD